MLPVLAVLSMVGPTFARPVPWAINFAAPGDFCFAGDVNGDGFADLIRVSPKGDTFIDVALNASGMKSLVPQRANSNWGKDCQAACVGNVDGVDGVDVVGVFGGDTLRIAHAFKDGGFKDEKEWVKLPKKLEAPHIQIWGSVNAGGKAVFVWSERTGQGFTIDPANKRIDAQKTWKGAAWVRGDNAWMDAKGRVYSEFEHRFLGSVKFSPQPIYWVTSDFGPEDLICDVPSGDPTVRGFPFPSSSYPEGPCVWCSADMDHDGDPDLIQFRFGPEPHSGHNVLVYRNISPRETDSDHDGLTNEEEAKLGTDPTNPDTDGDGLLDGWEVNGFRGLDMKAMGCDPRRPDAICLISRFSNAAKDMVEQTFKTIEGYYTSLGWALHPIFIEEMNENDQKQPWWASRDKFLPAKWRGVVHWMQITPWGGGQADQLGDGGGCGGNGWSLYATFIHEFGHQLGLSHEGFYPAAWCPTYPSMMNYTYSYGYEDDIKKIRYSDGALANFVMKETDLDETLPLPYEKVKFLEHAPYHYRLKANGNTTLIDWNWNGVFGEKHVRADINYAYSTTAGRRDEVGKTQCAPWTFVHEKSGYVLYGQQGVKADGKTDPSLLPDKPGWLILRRLIKPFSWGKEIRITGTGTPTLPSASGAESSPQGEATGDPVAISYHGEIVVAYPSAKGLAVRWLRVKGDEVVKNELTMVDDTDAVPSLGISDVSLILFEWMPKTGVVKDRVLTNGHSFGELHSLMTTMPTWGAEVATIKGPPPDKLGQVPPALFLPTAGRAPIALTSKVPVSMAVDTIRHEVILGLAQDQDKNRPDRWQIRRFKFEAGSLKETGTPEWIEGEKGGARGGARCIVLFDEKGVTGMKGRILYFSRGGISPQAPWACEYVAQSIGDKTIGGGWMVKRFYDEWTCSRSAQSACWFNGDILYAYRWVDGSQGDRDNILHVSYNGTGIEDAVMGDFNDIGFIREFGMRHSILYLRQ